MSKLSQIQRFLRPDGRTFQRWSDSLIMNHQSVTQWLLLLTRSENKSTHCALCVHRLGTATLSQGKITICNTCLDIFFTSATTCEEDLLIPTSECISGAFPLIDCSNRSQYVSSWDLAFWEQSISSAPPTAIDIRELLSTFIDVDPEMYTDDRGVLRMCRRLRLPYTIDVCTLVAEVIRSITLTRRRIRFIGSKKCAALNRRV
jgi:hypothetical protein